MDIKSTTNYRLIEGQEKQSLLDKYINQPVEFDRSTGNVEVFHHSSNLETTDTEISDIPALDFLDNPEDIDNQGNISSLSELISKTKASKSRQVQYHTRSERVLSKENLAETIRSMD
ncbi:MAG: hypothetical protein OXU45_07780 [Candidatus Melainabacteria bacterium]|nr:hypothetical protein [Candidatus Melainabacteria bacterium]